MWPSPPTPASSALPAVSHAPLALAAIKRGLDAMTAASPAESDQLARLADLLKRVWTDVDAPALNPSAKPPEPKK